MSGLPGSRVSCRTNLYPWRRKASPIRSSGFVFVARMRLMTAERLARVKTSTKVRSRGWRGSPERHAKPAVGARHR
jgi:hypothetical protein